MRIELIDFVTMIPARRDAMIVNIYPRKPVSFDNIDIIVEFRPEDSQMTDEQVILQAIIEGGKAYGAGYSAMEFMRAAHQHRPGISAFIADAALSGTIKESGVFGAPIVFIQDCPFRVAAIYPGSIVMVYSQENRAKRDCKVVDPDYCLVLPAEVLDAAMA